MAICWSSPPQAKIAVLDGGREAVAALSPLFAGESVFVIEPEFQIRHLTPGILLSTALYFLRCRSVQSAYIAALLSKIRPRIVVTFIDNSLLFQRVAKLLRPDIRFLAIQNGVRMLARDNTAGSPRIFHSEFACIGQRDVDEYRKQGAEVEHYYPVGSLKDAYYRARHPEPQKTKSFDLCLISQIKRQHYQHYPKTMASLELLAKHLKRFCDTHGTSLCVAARRHPQGKADLFDWETEWFREHLGEHAQIIPNDTSAFTSYSLLDQSKVSLALHTTLIHEGFGRGNRILSCNFTGDSRYDFPIPGPWGLSDTQYEVFEQRLLNLLHISDVEYHALCKDWPRYLIGYDPQCPTQTFLQQLIADAVAGAPAPFAMRQTH